MLRNPDFFNTKNACHSHEQQDASYHIIFRVFVPYDKVRPITYCLQRYKKHLTLTTIPPYFSVSLPACFQFLPVKPNPFSEEGVISCLFFGIINGRIDKIHTFINNNIEQPPVVIIDNTYICIVIT